jgi:hypothetical protein
MTFRNQIIFDTIKEIKNKKTIAFYQQLQCFANAKMTLFLTSLARNHKELIFINKDRIIQCAFDNMLTAIQSNFVPIVESGRQTALIEKVFSRMFAYTKESV